MRYLFLLSLFFTLPTYAARFADDVRSLEHDGDEVTVTFSSHSRVHRLTGNHRFIPCLENAYKAKKPVDVVVDDKDGNVTDCKLAPRKVPGAVGF
ncbi:MAG: hypothetical protein V4598_01405 [Bdellovibrionota bacterium]